jgi:hypothetical protein
MKAVKTKAQVLIVRSPEAFPDFTIYPKGWDLEPAKAANSNRNGSRKAENKLATFPKTTDSYL